MRKLTYLIIALCFFTAAMIVNAQSNGEWQPFESAMLSCGDGCRVVVQVERLTTFTPVPATSTAVPSNTPAPTATNTATATSTPTSTATPSLDVELWLINSDTEERFTELEDGAVITADFSQYNIEAVATGESVKFGNGRCESTPPYAAFGDWQGSYNDEPLESGEYTVSVEVFSQDSCGGDLLGSKTITYEIVKTEPTPPPAPTISTTSTPDLTCTETIDPVNYNWATAQPGDVLCIPAGTYQTWINVSGSGTASNPITVRGLGEVVLDGGRNGLIPECGGGSTPPASLSYGIRVYSHDYWTFENIDIVNFGASGIRIDPGGDDHIFRGMRIENNGQGSGGNGVRFAGQGNTFENVTVVNNAADAFQSGHEAGDTSLTIRNSFLGNTRPHSDDNKRSWNDCNHSDGVQSYDGHADGFVIENTHVVGVTNGFMLGDGSGADSVNNFTFKNVFIQAYENAIYCQMKCDGFTLENVTVYMPWMNTNHSIVWLDGSGHTVTDSTFIGTDGRASIGGRSVSVSNVCRDDVSGFGASQRVELADPPTAVGDTDYNVNIVGDACKGASDQSASAPIANSDSETVTGCPPHAQEWRVGNHINQSGVYCIPAGEYTNSVNITADNVELYAAGKVVFDGGGAPPPECGSGRATTNPPAYGIRINSDNVLVSGDITITGYKVGVMDLSESGRVVLDGLSVVDNGYSKNGQPEGHGIMISGNVTIRNAMVRDNGNDQIRNVSNRFVENVLIEDTTLAVLRRGSNGDEFNDCQHTDGLQIYVGSNNITVRRVWCQGLTQCVILGDVLNGQVQNATNVLIEDVTVVGASGIGILGKRGSDWTVKNTTIYCGPNRFTGRCVSLDNISGLQESNNIITYDNVFTSTGEFNSFTGWDMRPVGVSGGSSVYHPLNVEN